MPLAGMRGMRPVLMFLVHHFIVFVAFATGLGLGPGVLGESVRRPAYWKGLVVSFICVPLLTALVVIVLGVPRIGTALLLLIAVSPGAPTVLRKIRKAGGDLGLATALSITLTVLAIICLPLTLRLLNRLWGFSFLAAPGPLFRQVAIPVLVALAAGLLIHRLAPRAAHLLERVARSLVTLTILLVIVPLAIQAGPVLVHAWRALLAVVLLTLLSAILGDLAGRPIESERRTLSLSAAFGNPALVLAIVAFSVPGFEILPPLAAYVLVRAVTLFVYFFAVKRGKPAPRSARVVHPSRA